MKVRILSNLHLEFEPRNRVDSSTLLFSHGDLPRADADVVVLAGDVHTGDRGVRWAIRQFSVPVVYVAGNHEFYGGPHEGRVEAMKEAARGTHVHVFERGAVVIGGVRFLGATLWTDFALLSDPDEGMRVAARGMADYRYIRGFRPADAQAIHVSSRRWLERELGASRDGPTVVVTHMAPSGKSVHPRYDGNPLNVAFASNLDELVEHHQPALWVHGHTHDSFDYRIGETRVVCNPRGYFGHETNGAFDPKMVVTV